MSGGSGAGAAAGPLRCCAAVTAAVIASAVTAIASIDLMTTGLSSHPLRFPSKRTDVASGFSRTIRADVASGFSRTRTNCYTPPLRLASLGRRSR
jgi:hypothetical protein